MAKCNTCRFMRDDLGEKYSKYYLRCAWGDDRIRPWWLHAGVFDNTDAWRTRKTVIEEKGERLPDCPAHEPADG